MAKKILQNELKKAEIKSWRLLMEAFQAVFVRLEKGLAESGTSVSRFQILFYLYFEGPHKATELSKKLLVTHGNMSMFLKRMEIDGLIRFSVPSGQKRPDVTLSSRGEKFFEKIFPEHCKRVKSLVKPLTVGTLSELEGLKRHAVVPKG